MSQLPYTPTQELHRRRLLFALIGADFNVTTDQPIHKLFPFMTCRITGIWVTNASISLTAAQGGIYTALAKAGTAIVAATQSYAALTAPGAILDLTLADLLLRTEDQPVFALTTAQGAAATADVYVEGIALT